MTEKVAKTQSLAIHESLPFDAKYHQEDGESVCTVKQDDLEAFVSYHNAMKGAFKFAKIAFVIVAASTVLLGYQTLNSEPETRYLIPKEEMKN